MAWSPCPLKRYPGARQPDHQLPACSHRFQTMAPRATRVNFTPTTARKTRHVHRTHHLPSRGCPPHTDITDSFDISASRSLRRSPFLPYISHALSFSLIP